jgi:diacylglycerol kinase
MWLCERNARIHLLLAAVAVWLGWWVGLDRRDWVWLVWSIAAVMAAEAGNTAIEALVDLVSPEPHPLAKVAKDLAAGAVLLVSIAALLTGLLVVGPPLCERLGWPLVSAVADLHPAQ